MLLGDSEPELEDTVPPPNPQTLLFPSLLEETWGWVCLLL